MESVDALEREALAAFASAGSTAEPRDLEIKYLGKSGAITGLMRQIGQLPNEEKPKFGAKVNEAKNTVQAALDEKASNLKQGERAEQYERERIDVTMPGAKLRIGNEHV